MRCAGTGTHPCSLGGRGVAAVHLGLHCRLFELCHAVAQLVRAWAQRASLPAVRRHRCVAAGPTSLTRAGVYAEGDYTSYGGDMAELKTFVLSALLWDPALDDRDLIATFLNAYYAAAASYLQQYLDLWAGATQARAPTSLFRSPRRRPQAGT